LASCSNKNRLVQTWELPTGKRLASFELPGSFNSFHPPVLSPDGGWLAAVSEKKQKVGDREIKVAGLLGVWDTRSGKLKWSVPDSGVKCLAAAADGGSLAGYVHQTHWEMNSKGQLVGKSGKRSVTVWDAANGQTQWQTDSGRLLPVQLRFDSAQKRLLGMSSSTLVSWELSSGKLLEQTALAKNRRTFRLNPHRLRLSGDGRLAGMVGFMGQKLEVWDFNKVQQLGGMSFKFPNTIRNSTFSADLKSLVCVQNHKPVILHLSW